MIITGHDHLLDHWVERYEDGGVTYRRDDIVTGGGGAPHIDTPASRIPPDISQRERQRKSASST